MASSIGNMFKSLCLLFLNAECYTDFFVNYNFTNATCLKSALSKALGYAIISGSLIIKVPQILKIWRSKSGEGLSVVSVLLDLLAISSNVCYSYVNSYPFSAWGEGLFLMIQTYAVAALIFAFGPRPRDAPLFTAVYVAGVATLLSGAVPLSFLTTLQLLNVPIIIVGKSLQIIANHKNGSTGQLSALTVFMMVGGSVARVFTSLQETGDTLLVLTYAVAATLNSTVAAQLIYYWDTPAKAALPKESAGKKKVKTN